MPLLWATLVLVRTLKDWGCVVKAIDLLGLGSGTAIPAGGAGVALTDRTRPSRRRGER
jgi:hypothetical protein